MTRGVDYTWRDDPVAVGVVTAWRLWQVVELPRVGPRLSGWSSPELVWPVRSRSEATCLVVPSEHHVVPQPRCRCGFHGFRDREAAETALATEVRPTPWALGRVSLWGRAVEHARGWRAQYAYPYDLFIPDEFARFAGDLRSAYRVDVALLHVDELLQRVRVLRRTQLAARLRQPAA